jgi:hypothetical protein
VAVEPGTEYGRRVATAAVAEMQNRCEFEMRKIKNKNKTASAWAQAQSVKAYNWAHREAKPNVSFFQKTQNKK